MAAVGLQSSRELARGERLDVGMQLIVPRAILDALRARRDRRSAPRACDGALTLVQK
jgi:hypothetical protein